MKKKATMLTVLLCVLTMPVSLMAEVEFVNGYWWTYHGLGAYWDNEYIEWAVEIGCSDFDCDDFAEVAISPLPEGRVVIPSKLGNKDVEKIGFYAFRDCSGLTDVAIPDSVLSIDSYAFDCCANLTNVTIGSGLQTASVAFCGCNKLQSFNVSEDNLYFRSENGLLLTYDGCKLVNGVNGNVTIPNNVTTIGWGAFSGLGGLQSVAIPNSVTNIEYGAFENCIGLTSITIPNGVTSIADCSFRFCNGLKQVIIPNSVTNIGWRAFEGCNSLVNVTIPDSVMHIGDCAFDGCSAIVHYKGIDYPAGYFGSQMVVVGTQIRANDPTVMDVVYYVRSESPMVNVRVLAFEDGERSFAKVVRPETFVADVNGNETSQNVGDNVAANVLHRLSWKVSSDWATRLAKVKFEVLVKKGFCIGTIWQDEGFIELYS